MDIRPGSVLDGPNGAVVTVESLLGRGGFGQVFLGRLADGVRVAVKTVLTASLDPAELRTLRNEAKLATGIEHPHVVRVLHVSNGEDRAGDPPYLIMEFVEGGNLRGVIERHRAAKTRPTVEELRAMYLQIADGMRAVNAKVVHRDIKPENVLVDSEAGSLKITDFGLAKLADAATRSETFKGWGTLAYQAPEALQLGPNTAAMDVYATGVLFFEMATLAWPVQPKPGDNTPLAWRNAHLLSPPSDLRAARPDFPQDLMQLIMLMLQKDPRRRPQSWDSVIEALNMRVVGGAGRPDVTGLVQKATATLAQVTELEAKARAERERQAERNSLLVQAFNEPIRVLRELVEAFNNATQVGRLEMTHIGQLSVEVKAAAGQRRLLLTGKLISDLNCGHNGVYRMIGVARIEPTPVAWNQDEAFRDRESFGSFNLAYRVARDADRFGDWIVLRFEHNPVTGRISYPRWFAVTLDGFPRQLQVLNAMGEYQHQQQALNEEWFRLLLGHLL